ncbi:MAG TPA: hypothetical protein VNT26_10825, partial [Candidatus Sulfotelmatobacter sp.]|nr:hypothetical protein [Candidatus Sulfotelmatobacter sp.]
MEPSPSQLDFSRPRDRTMKYRPPDTLLRFHCSNMRVRGIMGPVGSGKSVACCQEIFSRAWRQEPWLDGVRRSRAVIVRNTYGELLSTTIKTWQFWFPGALCQVKQGAPITGKIIKALPDGTRMDLELMFLAMDRPDHTRKLLSLEVTFGWINEAREVPKEIVDALDSRLGRYPPMAVGGPTWIGMFMDTNPPDDGHWWFEFAEENRPRGWKFFHQPPAVVEIKGQWVKNNG